MKWLYHKVCQHQYDIKNRCPGMKLHYFSHIDQRGANIAHPIQCNAKQITLMWARDPMSKLSCSSHKISKFLEYLLHAWDMQHFISLPASTSPTETRRSNKVIMTSTRCCDVVLTSWWRYYASCAQWDPWSLLQYASPNTSSKCIQKYCTLKFKIHKW